MLSRHIQRRTRMTEEHWAFTMDSRLLLEATSPMDIAKLRLWAQLAGRASPIIQCKLYFFYIQNNSRNYYGHILIGLGNDLLLIGGIDDNNAYQTAVWRLSDNNWSQEANLIQVNIYWNDSQNFLLYLQLSIFIYFDSELNFLDIF